MSKVTQLVDGNPKIRTQTQANSLAPASLTIVHMSSYLSPTSSRESSGILTTLEGSHPSLGSNYLSPSLFTLIISGVKKDGHFVDVKLMCREGKCFVQGLWWSRAEPPRLFPFTS